MVDFYLNLIDNTAKVSLTGNTPRAGEWLDEHMPAEEQVNGAVTLEYDKYSGVTDLLDELTENGFSISSSTELIRRSIRAKAAPQSGPAKIPVKHVIIHWSESDAPGTEKRTMSLAEADKFLWEVASRDKSEIGYTKVSVSVVWADDEKYRTRMDVYGHKHPQYETPSIMDQIRRIVMFYTGDHCPPYLTHKRYDEHIATCARNSPTMRDEARHLLATHAM